MVLANLAQEDNIGNYVKHYMISNRQDDSRRKSSMNFFTKLGLTCAFADDCLYIKKKKGKIVLIILVYVDDMAIAALGNMHIISFKMALHNDFDITDLEELKFMLGIFVTHNHANRLIFLSQSTYIYQVLTHFGMQDATSVSTPLGVKHNLSISQSPMSEAEK